MRLVIDISNELYRVVLDSRKTSGGFRQKILDVIADGKPLDGTQNVIAEIERTIDETRRDSENQARIIRENCEMVCSGLEIAKGIIEKQLIS